MRGAVMESGKAAAARLPKILELTHRRCAGAHAVSGDRQGRRLHRGQHRDEANAGPSGPKSAPRTLWRALLMSVPQVNPGSRYRCGKRQRKSSLWATLGGKGGLTFAPTRRLQAEIGRAVAAARVRANVLPARLANVADLALPMFDVRLLLIAYQDYRM